MAITPLSASSEAPDGTQRRRRGQATPTYNSPPSSVFPTSKLEPAANQGEVKKTLQNITLAPRVSRKPTSLWLGINRQRTVDQENQVLRMRTRRIVTTSLAAQRFL